MHQTGDNFRVRLAARGSYKTSPGTGRNSLAQHGAAGGVLGKSEYRPEPRRGGRGPVGPREIAKQVETLSKQRRLSDNRVLVELIEQGIQARKEKEKLFPSWRNAFARRAIRKK